MDINLLSMHPKVYSSAPLKELRCTWSFTGKTTVQGVLRFLVCTVPPEILKTLVAIFLIQSIIYTPCDLNGNVGSFLAQVYANLITSVLSCLIILSLLLR